MSLLILLLLMCFGLSAESEPEYSVEKTSPEELEALVSSKEDLVLLDVRRPSELEELGTVEGYVNIVLSDLEERMGELPKDKPIVTICNRARRAGKAADLLKEKGYNVIGRFAMNDWKDEDRPVINPPTPESEDKEENKD